MSSPEKLKLKGWAMFCIYKMHSCNVSVDGPGIKKLAKLSFLECQQARPPRAPGHLTQSSTATFMLSPLNHIKLILPLYMLYNILVLAFLPNPFKTLTLAPLSLF